MAICFGMSNCHSSGKTGHSRRTCHSLTNTDQIRARYFLKTSLTHYRNTHTVYARTRTYTRKQMAPQAKIKLALSTTRRHIGGIEVHLHAFLTTILDAEERFKRRERTPVPTEEDR